MVCPTTAVFVFWTVRWLAQAPESVPRRRRRDASACTTTVFVTDDFWKVARRLCSWLPHNRCRLRRWWLPSISRVAAGHPDANE